MITTFFIFLTGFFFGFVPAALGLSLVGFPVALLVWTGRLGLLTGLAVLFRQIYRSGTQIRGHRELLFALAVFAGLQLLYYRFYYTLPEWDTYGDLIRIRELAETGSLAGTYRPLYFAAVTLLGRILYLPAYSVLLYVLLPLHLTLLLAARSLLAGRANFFWLSAFVAVPVINLETGIIRPQSLLLIFTPVFVYFLLLWQQTRNNRWLLPAGAIALFGLYYHEMFAFLLLALCLAFAVKKLKEIWRSRPRRHLAILSLGLMVTTMLWLVEIIPSLIFVKTFFLSMLARISNPANWRWWFLGSYGTDGVDIGWRGLAGVAQYYGYYVSPIVIIAGLALLLLMKRFRFRRPVDTAMLMMVLITYSLSEIFPRLGFVFLPERIWVIGHLLLLLLVVRLIGAVSELPAAVTSFVFHLVWLAAVITGIGGSVYLAKGKGSLTNQAEMQAAAWLKANTPASAVIYSQPANNPLVTYFAGRKIVTDNRTVFNLSPVTFSASTSASLEFETADRIYSRIKNFDINSGNTGQLLKDIVSYRSMVNAAKPEEAMYKTNNAYILYSLQKFNNLYSSRDWWKEVNYYGVNLDEMNTKYPLLYARDGVYIWKLN